MFKSSIDKIEEIVPPKTYIKCFKLQQPKFYCQSKLLIDPIFEIYINNNQNDDSE